MRRPVHLATFILVLSACGSQLEGPSATARPAATATASRSASLVALDLAGAIPESDLTGSDELHLTGLSAGADAVWLTAQDAGGGPAGALIRLDARSRDIRRMPIECGSACAAPAVGATHTWTVMNQGPTAWLIGVDASGGGEPARFELRAGAPVASVAVDEADQLWVGREGGIDLVSHTGELLATFDAPFEVRRDLGVLTATFAGPPVFGSLWAHDPAGPTVYRLDARDGTVMATIELEECPEIEYHRNYPDHSPLIYPLRGASGMAEAIVASCPMDVNHELPGPMHIIDPASNSVVAQIEIESSYGRGVVADDAWWVPIHPHRGDQTTGALARIDLGSHSVATRLEAPLQPRIYGPHAAVVISGEALWALVMPDDECSSATPLGTCRSLLPIAVEDLARSEP